MTGIEKKLNVEGGKTEERGCFDQARIHECPQTNKELTCSFFPECSLSDPRNLSPRATFKARFPVQLRAHAGMHMCLFVCSNIIFHRGDRHSRSFAEANIEPDVIQRREAKDRPVREKSTNTSACRTQNGITTTR